MKKISALPNSNADGVGGFTYGSVKDATAPGVYDGTPFRADWQNDQQAFFQRLLIEGGIVPSGSTDTPATSQLYSSLMAITGRIISSNITVTVGTGGDFSTINAAITYLSKFYPIYVSGGFTATINLLAGFVMAEQVIVNGIYLGWITITGVDAETTITRSALTVSINNIYGAFMASNGGVIPVIGQLYTMDASGSGIDRAGVYVTGASSSANILSGAGIKNSAQYGLWVNSGAVAVAGSANFSGANYPVKATYSAKIDAYAIDASNAGHTGISADNLSRINARQADASGAATYGLYAERCSDIEFSSGNAIGAGTSGIVANGNSRINAFLASARGTVGVDSATDVVVFNGAFIEAPSVGSGGISQTANSVTSNGIIFR